MPRPLEPDPDDAGVGKCQAMQQPLPSLFPAGKFPAEMPLLKIEHLSKQFERLPVVEQFDLTVPQNGFTVMIGPSGCGKTTLFNLLTGVIPKDEGVICWKDRELLHLGEQAAYMQQKDLLLPWLPLIENALLPSVIARSDLPKARKKAGRFFEQLGLGGFETYLPAQVSGGMRQRCALVRTLMFERDLVLLDEPLSALDAITRRRLQKQILMLQQHFDKTLLMITHDIEEALMLADELVLLSPRPMKIQERFYLTQPKPRRFVDPELTEIKAHVLVQLEEAFGPC